MAGRSATARALAIVSLATAGACLVPAFDPSGKACDPPAHPCVSGYVCDQGRCVMAPLVDLSAPASTVLAGTCASAQVTLRLPSGAPAALDASTTVALESDGGMRLFSDPACRSEASSVTVPAFAPDASFSFFALTGGRYQLSAAVPANRATLVEDVSPLVRAGDCALVDGAVAVSCPVAPPVLDASRAFAVFQANTLQPHPGDAGVRCVLAAADAVRCDRDNGSGEVDLRWQVAEVPGAAVQTLTTPTTCAPGGAFGFPLPAPVDPASTFLLFSESRYGTTYGVDDFSSVRLVDPSTVEVDNAGGCGLLAEWAVQAVTLPGLSVDRGVTGRLDAGVTDLDVTGLAPVPADRAILLHTHRYEGLAAGPICAKVVRGEEDDAGTALHFSRGVTGGQNVCAGPGQDILGISWERIQVAPGDRLQRLVVDLPATAAQVVVPVAAVDPTRTLVLASGQESVGQAYGETRDSSSEDARPAALMLALDDAGTSVRATRSVGAGSSRWSVYVWELGPAP